MKILVNERIHLSEIRQSDQSAYLEHLKEKEISEQLLRVPHP
jgi:hypothetical protein